MAFQPAFRTQGSHSRRWPANPACLVRSRLGWGALLDHFVGTSETAARAGMGGGHFWDVFELLFGTSGGRRASRLEWGTFLGNAFNHLFGTSEGPRSSRLEWGALLDHLFGTSGGRRSSRLGWGTSFGGYKKGPRLTLSQSVWQGPHGRSWRVSPCGRGHTGGAGESVRVAGATRAEPGSQSVWQGPHGRSWRVTPCGRGHTGGAGG